jgi:hypothetical protein
MDHLAEAEKELETALSISAHAPEATLALLTSQAHALIAIGHALETLAACVTANDVLHVATHREEA